MNLILVLEIPYLSLDHKSTTSPTPKNGRGTPESEIFIGFYLQLPALVGIPAPLIAQDS